MSDQSTRKIEDLRTDLTDKLGELHRRARHARAVLSPSTYWKNPWIRLGIGVAIGFALRGRRDSVAPQTHEGLAHAVIRAGLSTTATILVTQLFATPRSDG